MPPFFMPASLLPLLIGLLVYNVLVCNFACLFME